MSERRKRGKEPQDDLTKAEKALIKDTFPEYDRLIHVCKQCACKFADKRHNDGLVAVSLHSIAVFAGKDKRVRYSSVGLFGILSIKEMEVNSDGGLVVETFDGETLVIRSDGIMVARVIYRNYALLTASRPAARKISVFAPDRNVFPHVEIPLSLSQKFQFAFASRCTQYEIEYDNSVVQYVHSLIAYGNAIVDVGRVPAEYHRPMLLSLVNIPSVLGIRAENLDCPDVVTDIAEYVKRASRLEYLKIGDCNCKEGLVDLGKALGENGDRLRMETLIITDNKFKGIDDFLECIASWKMRLSVLSFSGLGLDRKASHQLMEALLEWKGLKSLQTLGVGGIRLSSGGYESLVKVVREAENLTCVDLSRSRGFGNILAALGETCVTDICMANCDFDEESITALAELAGQLTSCDVSDSNLAILEICGLLSVLGSLTNKATLTVKLNGINCSGKNVRTLEKGFLANIKSKWSHIELNNTQLTSTELEVLEPVFRRMPNLTRLHMDCNFTKDDAQAVGSVIDIPTIRSLSLAQSSLRVLCRQIANARHIVSLNLSNNNLRRKDACDLLSRDFEVLCIEEDEEMSDSDEIEDICASMKNLRCDPLLSNSMELIIDVMPLNIRARKRLNNYVVFVHSCICDDICLPLPCICGADVGVMEVGNEKTYMTPKLNSVAVEREIDTGRRSVGIELPLVIITGEEEEEEEEEMSNDSVDDIVNTNLIPEISDKDIGPAAGNMPEEDYSDDDDNVAPIGRETSKKKVNTASGRRNDDDNARANEDLSDRSYETYDDPPSRGKVASTSTEGEDFVTPPLLYKTVDSGEEYYSEPGDPSTKANDEPSPAPRHPVATSSSDEPSPAPRHSVATSSSDEPSPAPRHSVANSSSDEPSPAPRHSVATSSSDEPDAEGRPSPAHFADSNATGSKSSSSSRNDDRVPPLPPLSTNEDSSSSEVIAATPQVLHRSESGESVRSRIFGSIDDLSPHATVNEPPEEPSVQWKVAVRLMRYTTPSSSTAGKSQPVVDPVLLALSPPTLDRRATKLPPN